MSGQSNPRGYRSEQRRFKGLDMTAQKWCDVPDLPALKKDSEWNTALKGLEFFQGVILPELEPTPAEVAFLVADAGRTSMVLHWVVKKKWLSKHKIPFIRGVGKLYEPEGDFWYWLLELCIQCHLTSWGKPYRNASHWYSCLFWERKLPNIEYAVFGISSQNTNEYTTGMEAYRKNEQAIVGLLRKGENPFSARFNLHHCCLMQASIEMANSSDRFRSQYWRKFLAAYSKWINSLKNFNFISVETKNGTKRLVAQKGQGKHKVTLPLHDLE